MTFIRLLGIFLLCCEETLTQGIYFDLVGDNGMTKNDGEVACSILGMKLAILSDDSSLCAAKEYLQQNHGSGVTFWIDLQFDVETEKYLWRDGEEMTDLIFMILVKTQAIDKRNGNCVTIANYKSIRFESADCSSTIPLPLCMRTEAMIPISMSSTELIIPVSNGDLVFEVEETDRTVAFSISTVAPNAGFSINRTTGQITVSDALSVGIGSYWIRVDIINRCSQKEILYLNVLVTRGTTESISGTKKFTKDDISTTTKPTREIKRASSEWRTPTMEPTKNGSKNSAIKLITDETLSTTIQPSTKSNVPTTTSIKLATPSTELTPSTETTTHSTQLATPSTVADKQKTITRVVEGNKSTTILNYTSVQTDETMSVTMETRTGTAEITSLAASKTSSFASQTTVTNSRTTSDALKTTTFSTMGSSSNSMDTTTTFSNRTMSTTPSEPTTDTTASSVTFKTTPVPTATTPLIGSSPTTTISTSISESTMTMETTPSSSTTETKSGTKLTTTVSPKMKSTLSSTRNRHGQQTTTVRKVTTPREQTDDKWAEAQQSSACNDDGRCDDKVKPAIIVPVTIVAMLVVISICVVVANAAVRKRKLKTVVPEKPLPDEKGTVYYRQTSVYKDDDTSCKLVAYAKLSSKCVRTKKNQVQLTGQLVTEINEGNVAIATTCPTSSKDKHSTSMAVLSMKENTSSSGFDVYASVEKRKTDNTATESVTIGGSAEQLNEVTPTDNAPSRHVLNQKNAERKKRPTSGKMSWVWRRMKLPEWNRRFPFSNA